MERAANSWISKWIERHPDRDEDTARSEWESLSIETRSHLMNINEMEIRITEEIRKKLLQTLADYPCQDYLKDPFREACK